MIVKSKSRKTNTFHQLLEYMMDDKGRMNGAPAFVLTQNVKGTTIDSWAAQLESNEQYRLRTAKNSTKVIHEILSFHRDDVPHLTPHILQTITQKYLEMRSINGMFVAIPHLHDAHWHVHICGSPIEYLTGKSLRMSRKEFKALKLGIQQYQFNEFPQLSRSVVNHDPP